MHVCETLWSDIDGTDRENITKINGAAPADPFSTPGKHDTCSRAPIWTFHGRVVVFATRANRVSFELMVTAQLISSTIDLGDVFPVCPIDIRPQCFASMHQMRTDV